MPIEVSTFPDCIQFRIREGVESQALPQEPSKHTDPEQEDVSTTKPDEAGQL